MGNERWVLKNAPGDPEKIAKNYGISPLLARLILNRGNVTPASFRDYLYPDQISMPDPGLLPDVDKLCQILEGKIADGKRIRVMGDYDVDGVTATAMLVQTIRDLGGQVDYVIPHRVKDGYGLHIPMIEKAYEEQIDTILTCDTGISAGEEVARAKELGMTVLITDHHDVPYREEKGNRTQILPPADAVVNPKREPATYPFPDICGANVVYKIVSLLYQRAGKEMPPAFLEYAALATVCDVMPLQGENRSLVRKGLKAMQRSTSLGLGSLIAQVNPGEVNVFALGFRVGPCLNATGRLETAKEAVELLLETDPERAEQMAAHLQELNEERKRMTDANLQDAIAQAEQYEATDPVLVLYLPECHESLAGIVAGRVKELFYRPVLVLTKGAEECKGSGRSIDGYPMFDKLTEVSHLLSRYGGHPMAAGLSLPEENVPALREELNARSGLTEELLTRKILLDASVTGSDLTLKAVRELALLEPCGTGNPKPLFGMSKARVIRANKFGNSGNVLRMTFFQEGNQSPCQAVIFGQENITEWEEEVRESYGQKMLLSLYRGDGPGILMDLAVDARIDTFRDVEQVQLVVRHYRFRK